MDLKIFGLKIIGFNTMRPIVPNLDQSQKSGQTNTFSFSTITNINFFYEDLDSFSALILVKLL